MLRQFIIWLMKVMLDFAIALSLFAVIAIAVALNRNAGGDWATTLAIVAEIVIGAFGLVGLFGLLSLLIEINENLIRLRQVPPTALRRAGPMSDQSKIAALIDACRLSPGRQPGDGQIDAEG
jgi:hypothetical protein